MEELEAAVVANEVGNEGTEVTDDFWYVKEKLVADEVEDVVVGEEADEVTDEG